MNSIKRLRYEDEMKLNDLLKTKENLASLANAKVKLGQLYEQVLENLQYATEEIKALALDALDVKVYTKGLNDVEIQGVIPLELALPTTGQTSGCLILLHYNSTDSKESVSILPSKFIDKTLVL